MAPLVRLAGRLLARLALGVGWLLFVLSAGLFLAEESGWLALIVRDAIAANAGTLGADVEVDDAELEWFALALRVEGLRVGEGGEIAEIRAARIVFGPRDEGGLGLSRAEVDGGHVRLSPALENAVAGFQRRMAEREGTRPLDRRVPTVTIRDFGVAVDSARLGHLPIGRVDLALEGGDAARARISGRIVPYLAAGGGDAGEVYLSGERREDGGFDVRATAAGLPLSTRYLPQARELEPLRALDPGGLLALTLEASLPASGRGRWTGSARLALDDASLALAGGAQRIEGLHADLELALDGDDPGDPASWRGRAQASGRWADASGALAPMPFTARVDVGEDCAPGTAAELALHVPRLALARELLALLGPDPANEVRWRAFEPRGEVEAWVTARIPCDGDLSQPLARWLELGLEVGFEGRAGLTYHGWPNPRTRVTDLGFPLPVDGATGTLVFARDPRRERPAVLGLLDLAGTARNGPIEARGLVVSPSQAVPVLHDHADLDLSFASARLAVDDGLRDALAGLSGVVKPSELWEAYAPQGGAVGVAIRLVRTQASDEIATDLTLDVDGTTVSWNDLPIPLRDARGRIRFVSDGHGERGAGVALAGTLATAKRAEVALRLQTEPGTHAPHERRRMSEVETVSLSVEELALTGDDKKALVARHPVIGSAMSEIQSRGFADVLYRRTRHAEHAEVHTLAEIVAREVQIQPRQFQMNTNAVRGRVLIEAFEPSFPAVDGAPAAASRVDTRLAPLVGTWGQDVEVAFVADFSEELVRLYGAGIDPSNKGLLGALGKAFEQPGGSGGVDVTAIVASGPIDFTGVVELAREEGEEASRRGRLFLRGNSLESGAFRLDALHGVLDWEEGRIRGERLAARLARTPVDLSDLEFETSAQGYRLETRISAEDLPLDREHLRSFVDEDTLEALLGGLRWRGRVDVEEGRIVLAGPPQGEGRVEFRGRVTPHDMFVQLGLPLAIRSASATIDELVLEGGRVRAVGRIRDLYGRVADRELGPAELLLTYFEPRLSIESLEGALEGGRIGPLGGGAERGGTAFSIDLEEPFPFQLALALDGVEVAGLLRGLFPSNVATRGLLDAEMRLSGDTEHLLAIQGSGSVVVRETRLWSVPVFRALFSQLGFDDTAVFDQMAANLRVRDGVISMDDIAVHSPLLQLVGSGTLDFDGSLRYDLEVRYDLVDRLGPLTRLLYSIQNKLLGLAIRGDMSRPVVILKNPLRGLFGGIDDDARALPLPGYTPLPARF